METRICPNGAEAAPHLQCRKSLILLNFRGGGPRFDALRAGLRVLWAIKTHQFDTYTDFLRRQVIKDQIEELQEERAIAMACGYDFVVGVAVPRTKKRCCVRIPLSISSSRDANDAPSKAPRSGRLRASARGQ